MNDKQKKVLTGGLALIALNCLFPPYSGGKAGKNIGYHFILAPPQGKKVFRALYGDAELQKNINNNKKYFESSTSYLKESYDSWQQYVDSCYANLTSRIIATQFFAQLFTLVILTAGLFFLLSDRKTEG